MRWRTSAFRPEEGQTTVTLADALRRERIRPAATCGGEVLVEQRRAEFGNEKRGWCCVVRDSNGKVIAVVMLRSDTCQRHSLQFCCGGGGRRHVQSTLWEGWETYLTAADDKDILVTNLPCDYE